jgi:hypothetical protein
MNLFRFCYYFWINRFLTTLVYFGYTFPKGVKG